MSNDNYDPNFHLGYCVYYGSGDKFDGEYKDRECFRTLTGVIRWLKKHADEFLKENDISIEREYLTNRLWERLEE